MNRTFLKMVFGVSAAATLALTPLLSLADTANSALVQGGALNLRETASITAKVLGQYPTGTLVEITESGDDWSKVFVSGKTGYMMTRYLNSANGSISATVHTNTGVGLNMREAPSLSGKLIATAADKAAVNVLQKGAEWSRVAYDGKEGFMATRYLSFAPAAPVTPSGIAAVVNNPRDTQVLNLREKPSLDARVLAYYRNGVIVTVTDKQTEWCKVLTPDGKNGYMMTKFLKLSDTPAAPVTATTMNVNGGSYVNFRSAPSLKDAYIQGRVPVNTSVTVLERGTDWCKVEVDGKTGYLSTWFLKF